MSDWDWDSIDVVSGEWWLVLLSVLFVLIGVGIGASLGYRKGLNASRWPENYNE